jgi:hypothetical protein
MIIRKIISGAQTGADRAALDAAIMYGIPHGGWVPKGRKAEDGTVPGKYQVTELRSADYKYRTEMNVKDSSGTLILTHGKLTGGSALTLKYAHKHGKPCLHIDLNEVSAASAVIKISRWIEDHQVDILNCAGSRISKDPKIYDSVFNILDAVLYIEVLRDPGSYRSLPDFNFDEHTGKLPENVDEAVDALVNEMPLKTRFQFARVKEYDSSSYHFSLALYVRNNYRLWQKNSPLLEDCCRVAGAKALHVDDASHFIIKTAWERIKKDYGLRVIK